MNLEISIEAENCLMEYLISDIATLKEGFVYSTIQQSSKEDVLPKQPQIPSSFFLIKPFLFF